MGKFKPMTTSITTMDPNRWICILVRKSSTHRVACYQLECASCRNCCLDLTGCTLTTKRLDMLRLVAVRRRTNSQEAAALELVRLVAACGSSLENRREMRRSCRLSAQN